MIMPTIYGATVQFGHPGGPAIAETRTQEFADTQKRRPHRRDVQCEDIPYQSLRFIRRLYPYRGSETKWLFSSQFLNSHTPASEMD
jgi:hypothetical protein